ncbi:MAG: hypothetical protein AAF600_08675, partial [Bacteroidota bacterium]
WVDSKKGVTLHFTPTYASWLHQIEIWFNILSKDVLKGGGIWHSKQQLVDQLLQYVKTCNKTRANLLSGFTMVKVNEIKNHHSRQSEHRLQL